LPAQWYCRDCDATLPRDRFKPRRDRRPDGSVYFKFEYRCAEHERAYMTRWRKRAPLRRPAPVETLRTQPAERETDPQAAERAERAEKRRAFVGFIRQYAADQWERDVAWLLDRSREPEQVEARALVVAILYYEHGFGITEAGRAVRRDHSTALHILGKYMPQDSFQELLRDYRHLRAQRKAARAARKAG
jgi:hypothetical protein